VGLSGNLGFTHSPRTVFEAARILRKENDIHFLLSGWGVGWKELVELQNSVQLENVTLVDPVPQSELVDFLSAADLWVIPYRHNTAGVSVPSRFYNLLAVGRAVAVAAEPNSEAALLAQDEDVGWVVPPEDPVRLAQAIRQASLDRAGTMQKGQRAAKLAKRYDETVALARYRQLIAEIQKTR
jgi:glycosyltransferase involved in cell wall biosynthesis